MDLSKLSDGDLIALYSAMRGAAPKPKEPAWNPADEMSTGDKVLAGIGSAFVDPVMGLGQRLGIVSQNEADDRARLNKNLMDTGAGTAGNIIGKVASLAPTAMVPGANTLVGSAVIGAIAGALEPTKSGESAIGNAATGGAFGAAIPAATALYKTGKALVAPFTRGGQEQIASDVIKRFATDPQAAANALRNPTQYVPGSLPTAAEASLDPGIAVLQRSAMAADPQMAGAFAQREAANMSARIDALKGIAKDASERDFFDQARKATAEQLYAKAFSEAPADTAWIKGQVTQLMRRPAFIQALKDGQEIAKNEGLLIGRADRAVFDPSQTTRILHYTKMALDDQAQNATGNARRAILDTRDKLVSMMESKDFSPSYREARDTFKQMSKPINQMDVGQTLYEKMIPALADVGDQAALPRVRAEAYANALRNADATAQQAIGFKGARMADVLTPEQMNTVQGIAKDLSRRASAQEIGKVSGSPTAQYLSSQNLMQQMAGPLGMPKSWVEGALMQTMARPIDFVAKRSDPMIQKKIAETLLDPSSTAAALEKASRQNPAVYGMLARYLPVTTAGGLLGYSR